MFCVVLSDLFLVFQFFFDFVFDLPLPSPEKGLIAFDTVDLRDVKKNIHQNSSFAWPSIGLYLSLHFDENVEIFVFEFQVVVFD